MLFVSFVNLLGVVNYHKYSDNESKTYKRYECKERSSGLESDIVCVKVNFFRTKQFLSFWARKSTLVNYLPVMLRRSSWLISVDNVMIKAIFRICSIYKTIDKIPLDVDIIQGIGCKTEEKQEGREERKLALCFFKKKHTFI